MRYSHHAQKVSIVVTFRHAFPLYPEPAGDRASERSRRALTARAANANGGRLLRVGVALPFFVGALDVDGVWRIVDACIDGGFDALWVSDHVSGPTPMGSDTWLEAITLLSHIAARAPGLTLGTDVLVAPYRHPLLAAKMLTTLDVVCGGRLVVAVGAGYIEAEFRQLGVPFVERGMYTDECIEVWRAAWADGPLTHRGRFFQIEGAVTEPKPVQRPGPPVWIGGHSARALDRAARLGDGWHPIGIGLDAYRAGRDRIAERVARLGRPLPTLSYSAIFGIVGPHDPRPERPLLSGDPTQVVEDLVALADLGVANVVLRPGLPGVACADVVAQLDVVAAEVLAALDR